MAAGTALLHGQKSRGLPVSSLLSGEQRRERHSTPGRLQRCLVFQLISLPPESPFPPALSAPLAGESEASLTQTHQKPSSPSFQNLNVSTSSRLRDLQAPSLQRLSNPQSFLSSPLSSAPAHAAPSPFPRGFAPRYSSYGTLLRSPVPPPSL